MHPGAPASAWCERGDSNPHELPHRNLNPARLPVSPPSHAATIYCGVALYAVRPLGLPASGLGRVRATARFPGPLEGIGEVVARGHSVPAEPGSCLLARDARPLLCFPALAQRCAPIGGSWMGSDRRISSRPGGMEWSGSQP